MLDSVPFLPGDFYLKYQLLPMLNAVPTQQAIACGFNWDAFKTPQNSFQLSCFAPQFVYKKESEDFENLMGNVVNESTYIIENKADKIELKDKDGKVVVSNLKANAKIYAYSNKQKDIVAFDLPDFSNKHFTYLLFKDSADNCFQAGVLPSDFYPYLIFRHEKEWYSLATCSLKAGLLPEVTGIFKLNLSTSLAAADSQMHQQEMHFLPIQLPHWRKRQLI